VSLAVVLVLLLLPLMLVPAREQDVAVPWKEGLVPTGSLLAHLALVPYWHYLYSW
jgi:hypothetical protein